MEMQNLKNAVVTGNADALQYLQQGQYRQATTGFLAALQSAKLLLNGVGPGDDSVAAEPTFSSVEVDPGPGLSAPTNEGMIPLFNQCLLVEDQRDLETMLARSQDTIPCLLLYNVGLSLQLEAIQTGNDTLTSKALNAYEIGLTILTGISQVQPMGADNLFLLLAILNNAASIEADRFNVAKAMQYVQLIQDILENDEFTDMLGDSVFDFFVLYLFQTPTMCISAAPAA